MTGATARPSGGRRAAPLPGVPASEPDDVQVVPVVAVTLAESSIPGGSLPAPAASRVPDASRAPAALRVPDASRAPAALRVPAAAPALKVASWLQAARHLALKASAARST